MARFVEISGNLIVNVYLLSKVFLWLLQFLFGERIKTYQEVA